MFKEAIGYQTLRSHMFKLSFAKNWHYSLPSKLQETELCGTSSYTLDIILGHDIQKARKSNYIAKSSFVYVKERLFSMFNTVVSKFISLLYIFHCISCISVY